MGANSTRSPVEEIRGSGEGIQREGPWDRACKSIVHMLSLRVRRMHLARLFCSDVYGHVIHRMMPCARKKEGAAWL
jgi:hypothetical protein